MSMSVTVKTADKPDLKRCRSGITLASNITNGIFEQLREHRLIMAKLKCWVCVVEALAFVEK